MKSQIHCAIYTRKSTDEGLEQEFNSLDAQREACEAYIISQKHEGWKLLPKKYDDGGFSGGTMERPALKHLLNDIEAGRVNVVVVYKVDRLTRSLSDFSKIVEIFDKRGASFVSITQQFNTTSSMGRLTLNVLLSFAQFEREVTGERIRDKIAASKAKGMWMGGAVPLGYDTKDKKLIVNTDEAKLIRHIFERYISVKSYLRLRDELNKKGYRTKHKSYLTGKARGGLGFQHSHLRHILRNKLYIGMVTHNGKEYPGEHEAIISQETWNAAQQCIADNTHAHRTRKNVKNPSLLIGKIFDGSGNRLTGSGSNRGAECYRYYETSPGLKTGPNKVERPLRVPAIELDKSVCRQIAKFLENSDKLFKKLPIKNLPTHRQKNIVNTGFKLARRLNAETPQGNSEVVRRIIHDVHVGNDYLQIRLLKSALCRELGIERKLNQKSIVTDQDILHIESACTIRRFGYEKRIIISGETEVAKSENYRDPQKSSCAVPYLAKPIIQ